MSNISKEAIEAALKIGELIDPGPIWRDDVEEIIQSAIDTHEEAMWRPVSEPPDHELLILLHDGVSIWTGICNKYEKWEDNDGYDCQPTHWRELPTAPKRKGAIGKWVN